jgi:hypothetical protein
MVITPPRIHQPRCVLADGRLVSVVNALAGGAASLPLGDGRSAFDVRVDARSS